MSPEELELGKPWTEEGKTYFKIKGLQEFLKHRSFTKYTRPQMQERLKAMNNNEDCTKNYRYKNEKGEWKRTRVWWINEIKDTEVELPTGEESHEPIF
jgi:hypothetical protein